MSTVLRRLAFLGTFVAIMPPFVPVALVTMLWAGAYWLTTGKNADHILLNRAMCWLTDLPFKAGGKPGVLES